MADYPSHLVREHRLSDGRCVLIRPVKHDDEKLETDFVRSLSNESRYLRFQKWVRAPSEKLIHFLTDVDYDRHLGLVCIARDGRTERMVGEARYVVDPEGRSCDFGIMVADDWRKTGVAGLLMAMLMRAARERGLLRMESQVMCSNVAMLRFARGLGFEIEHAGDDITSVRIVKNLRRDSVPPLH